MRCTQQNALVSNAREENNMNKIEEWYYTILDKEGLSGWKIKWNTGGGLCVYNHKEIWMDKKRNDDFSLFLHEVAHALAGVREDWDKTGHDAIFADTYTRLVKKYTKRSNHELII